MDDFETFTKILDWDLLTGLSDLGKEYALSPLPSFFSSSLFWLLTFCRHDGV